MLSSRGLVKISAVEKNGFVIQAPTIQNHEALTANSGHQKFKTMRLLQP